MCHCTIHADSLLGPQKNIRYLQKPPWKSHFPFIFLAAQLPQLALLSQETEVKLLSLTILDKCPMDFPHPLSSE